MGMFPVDSRIEKIICVDRTVRGTNKNHIYLYPLMHWRRLSGGNAFPAVCRNHERMILGVQVKFRTPQQPIRKLIIKTHTIMKNFDQLTSLHVLPLSTSHARRWMDDSKYLPVLFPRLDPAKWVFTKRYLYLRMKSTNVCSAGWMPV